MRGITRIFRSIVLSTVLVSTLFASSVLADSGITASGERYSDANDNDSKTVSVEFRNIPAEYEGWQAATTESMPVCGVVTNAVVSCEFRNQDPVNGAWLILYKRGTDQVASFYVSFHVNGMKQPKEEIKPAEDPDNCKPAFDGPSFSEECPQ